jgi:succinoglycan biosynthesis transport protein ExoP
MQTKATVNLGERLQTLRRRRRPLLLAIGVGIALTLLVAFLWPPTYRSSAVILIEQQEIPQDLVRSTITSYADQRVQVISQRVMTTANLLDIIHRYKLYPRDQKTKPREVLIEQMRDDIGMNMISANVMDPRSGHPTQATIAFSVAYDSRSPELALKVASELTTLYLNENLTNRKQLTHDTATFLTAEADRLNGEIADLEKKLAAFKETHVDNLPELAQLNFQLVDRTEQEVRDTETRIRSLDDQTTYLKAQLAQINPASQLFSATGERILSATDRLKALRTQLASLSALYAPDHPDVLRARREIEGLEREVQAPQPVNDLARRLEDARSELASVRQRYSADHPDVLRLERTVASLEETLRSAPPQTAAAASAAPGGGAAGVDPPDNPAYIQIRAQLESAENERQSLDGKRTELKAKIAEFDRKLAQSPQIEREYRALSRDYENARAKYQDVRAKQMEAELAQNLESDRKGERFTLIEPPLPPEKPISPNRALILVLGALLALGAGIATVAVLESLDTTIRNRKDLTELLDTPPLAVIPQIQTLAESARSRARWRTAMFGAAGGFVTLILALHFLYRPLDVLWFSALRRLGV